MKFFSVIDKLQRKEVFATALMFVVGIGGMALMLMCVARIMGRVGNPWVMIPGFTASTVMLMYPDFLTRKLEYKRQGKR